MPITATMTTLPPSFFFLMIRRPPRSTLFPTRRSSDLHAAQIQACHSRRSRSLDAAHVLRTSLETPSRVIARSEEHTSELQSHSDLGCRLLLEKKIYSSFLPRPLNRISIASETTRLT